ncbi:MAG TPA: hypothetical protein PKE29_06920 [Phycisphaerales bacterium]|nr:hypothetical protein [Phycisphaerales bacterium]
MKHRVLWAIWAIVPVAAIALHMGPGQRLLASDRAGDHLSRALAAEAAEDYATAATEYAAAKADLPEDRTAERARLSLREAKANVFAGNLIEGAAQLESLITELGTPTLRGGSLSESESATLLDETRDALGTAAYFTAWTMRLEGAAADEWKPETELARQQFRLLAETAIASGDKQLADAATKNDEQVIRLERMDISELAGLPLPKKCKCNGSCCQKKRAQRMSKCQGKKPSDARDQIKKNSAGQAQNREKGS